MEYESLEVLSARGNFLVRLSGTDVVARAATLTALTRRQPADWLAREVRAAAAGGPVIPPSPVVAPGPHLTNGVTITFWTSMPAEPAVPTAAEIGHALARFHSIAGQSLKELDLPQLAAVNHQIPEGIGFLSHAANVDASTLRHLEREFATVLKLLDGAGSTPVVLHGDAHPGNIMRSAGYWRWFDLEETGLGPPAWDLAVLSHAPTLDGRAAVDAYARDVGIPSPTDLELAPFVRARQLEAAVWALGVAQHYPERYAAMAIRFLDVVVSRH